MGGCASRPKVLRDDIDAPIPLPPPAAVEEDRGKQEEVTKDVVVVVEEAPAAAAVNGESQFEVVDDANDIPSVTDDDLSSQDEKQRSEEVKEEIFETKEASEPSESKPQQHENPAEEQARDLIVVDATAEPEETEVAAASMAAEVSEPETCMEKTIEEVKEVTEVTRMDDKDPERETGEDLDIIAEDDDVPKPETEGEEEGSDFGLDHSPQPENNTEVELEIVEDNALKTEEKIEEKQVITDEKPREKEIEEEEEEDAAETTTATEGSKKPKKQYWHIGSLLSFGKSK